MLWRPHHRARVAEVHHPVGLVEVLISSHRVDPAGIPVALQVETMIREVLDRVKVLQPVILVLPARLEVMMSLARALEGVVLPVAPVVVIQVFQVEAMTLRQQGLEVAVLLEVPAPALLALVAEAQAFQVL